MIKLNGVLVTPTIFPDGTSQVWKLDESSLKKTSHHIEWDFENEGELMQVLQLGALVKHNYALDQLPSLSIPFLPYSRQDKPIGNNSTFALSVFLEVLNKSEVFKTIQTIDVHNPGALVNSKVTNSTHMVQYKIQDILQEVKPNLICFPDAGAATRGYPSTYWENKRYVGNKIEVSTFNLEKKRNQLTGEIEGLKTSLPLKLDGLTVLIMDDICDGGKTFIEASKLLYNMGASEVNLYVTHGIFSKGVQVLKDSGIKRIFTYKGEV